MADLTITAANVLRPDTLSVIDSQHIAGGTITQGQPVYMDTSDSNKLKAARANAATTDYVFGIALNAASSGQHVTVLREGNITIGATLTVGQTYVLSAAAAGGIAPISDLVSTNYVSILGVATTASNLKVQILNAETAKA